MINLIIDLINKIIELLGGMIDVVLALLPDSPFSWDLSSIGADWFKIFAWVVPVPSIVASVYTFTLAVATYYMIRVVLRWIKIAGE